MKSSLKSFSGKSECFSLALESTDVKETAQLAVFIRGVHSEFGIIEDSARLYPMKGTTVGDDIA